MYPGQFEYQRPSSVQEAVAILAGDPDAKVLAGGHSLVPAMKLRLAMPGTLVDIGRIAELKGITVNGGATIGAMTTYDELQDSADLDERLSGDQGNGQHRWRSGRSVTRHARWVAGHSDPAADFTAVMLALSASSRRRDRMVSARSAPTTSSSIC